MESRKINKSKQSGTILSRWLTRYMMATEMYMVEPWEKVFIHVLFAIVFGLFWYFNYSIIFNVVSQIRDSPQFKHYTHSK